MRLVVVCASQPLAQEQKLTGENVCPLLSLLLGGWI